MEGEVRGGASAWVFAVVSTLAFRSAAESSLVDIGFEPIRESDGVTVFSDPEHDLVRVAAEGVFDAPVDQVLAALTDYPAHAGTIGRLRESRVLESGPGWRLVYQRLDLPVVSDRDYVLLARWRRTGEVVSIRSRAVADRGPPPVPGVVRVTRHEVRWRLRPARGGRATSARFIVAMDIGGLVPQGMVRRGSSQELPRLFSELRGLVRGGT